MRYKGKYCRAKLPRKRKNNKIWVSSLCVLLAVFVITTGAVFAKYKQTVALDPVNLTVSSGHLADVFTLQEHKAVRNSDGTYGLDLAQTVQSNHYQVTPGVAIPKDPYFTIEGKSKVPAYLYVEVINGLGDSGLSYNLTDDWMDLNLTGKYGGKVYVYTGGDNKAKLLDENFGDQDVSILLDDQVTVKKTSTSGFDVSLSFHGYLAQVSLAVNAESVYKSCFGVCK